eukprot:2208081-Rhodomonas_salina.1
MKHGTSLLHTAKGCVCPVLPRNQIPKPDSPGTNHVRAFCFLASVFAVSLDPRKKGRLSASV